MFNIVICEDENVIRRKIEVALNEISVKHDIDIEVSLSTADPLETYNYVVSKKTDILLLDIDLKDNDMDGIKLGNELRKIDKNIIIVFISSRLEKIFECFTCNPFDFIPKPSISPHLEETILRIMTNKLYVPHGNFIKIKNNVINTDEIIYIEKQLAKALFYSNSSCTEIYISFLQLLSCLPDNFIQINKSYIVNKLFIVDINTIEKNVYLKNGQVLKYSAKFIKDIGGILNARNNKSFNNGK